MPASAGAAGNPKLGRKPMAGKISASNLCPEAGGREVIPCFCWQQPELHQRTKLWKILPTLKHQDITLARPTWSNGFCNCRQSRGANKLSGKELIKSPEREEDRINHTTACTAWLNVLQLNFCWSTSACWPV